ncbi:BTB/POZ domain-containing protein 6-B-like [Contarinia nasturtii]|uniref:BTB/POZ domain-containing protein 6-B-like n=1 Tax=Contarinia nasturtii TaxID=265458 RepID=UPI0012D42CF6|nr:BTB/POZ domain-containing protein 6-B-like [Contarinia nasturtii]
MSESERSERNYKLTTNVGKLNLDEETADVAFIFENGEDNVERVVAHKCLLAAGSPVFKRMFYGDLKEGTEVPMVDVSIDGFAAFLQYFYLDIVTYNNTVIGEVMKLADKYDVAGCMELCTRYLTLTLSTQNVCGCYELALLFDLGHLISVCEEKICLETQKVLESSSFLSCSRHILGRILLMDGLSCDEIHVFQASMMWAMEACKRAGIDENNADNLKQQLGNCFDLIRFPAMSAEDFYTCIADKENLLTSNEIMDILSHLTMHRPLLVATRFEQTARKGIPAWTKDDIQICDRRTLPNLCRTVADLRQDVVMFSVNERILVGEIAISCFKALHDDTDAVIRTGELCIRKMNESSGENPQNATSVQRGSQEEGSSIEPDVILQQSVTISSTSSTKIQLSKPIIVQPFQLYEIESNWELEEGEELTLRTEMNDEVMLDGGVRFQFKRKPELTYDNVTEGLLSRLYFKQW